MNIDDKERNEPLPKNWRKLISIFVRNDEKMLKTNALISFLFTTIPPVWVTICMLVIYTIPDAIIPLLLSIVALGAGFIACYAILKRSSILFVFLYFTFTFILGLFFTILSYIWFFIPISSIWGIRNSIRLTNNYRKFIPRFKSARCWTLTLSAILLLVIPGFIYIQPPAFVYTLEKEGAAENIEINFTYANETTIEPELLQILIDSNNLEYINVSLTLPILEDMMISNEINDTNTVRDPDRPMRGDYSDPDDCESDLREYERSVIDLVENTPADELQSLHYLTNCLAVNETKKLWQAGIKVDFMPLLPKSTYYMYINDKTINRYNKTIAIFKNWIEKSGLQKYHRGLIIDTERDWGNDLETILSWWDYSAHNSGIIKLGKLIRNLKLLEYGWKLGDNKIDEFSEQNWQGNIVEKKLSYVAGATFGVHIDDLFDLDDAQQNLFKISILPPSTESQFDFVGIMTYETGLNSEHAVFGYCKAGDYFFGERNVPYIYSGLDHVEDNIDNPYEYMNEIIRKFRVCQNYGYEFVGIWALISEYCFEKGWCGGLYDFFNKINKTELIFEICKALDKPQDVTFVFSNFNFAWVHGLVSLLDIYLVTPNRYASFPINNYPKIRN